MRLLVGVDGTEKGVKALEEAIDRAREGDHQIKIAVFSATDEPLSEIELTVEEYLQERSFEASIECIETDPGSTLIELAELGNYDEIVIPGGTTSPLGKVKLNSTIEFVLLNAHTSVKLIR